MGRWEGGRRAERSGAAKRARASSQQGTNRRGRAISLTIPRLHGGYSAVTIPLKQRTRRRGGAPWRHPTASMPFPNPLTWICPPRRQEEHTLFGLLVRELTDGTDAGLAEQVCGPCGKTVQLACVARFGQKREGTGLGGAGRVSLGLSRRKGHAWGSKRNSVHEVLLTGSRDPMC